LPGTEVRADLPGRELIVSQPLHALGRIAAQHVDEMPGPKALAGAVDAGERLLRGFGAVPDARRVQAAVAVAAGRARFAEVSEHADATAAGGLRQADQRLELAVRDALVRLAGLGLGDHAPLLDHVTQAVRHPGVGRQAVAARAAGLLVVGFDA